VVCAGNASIRHLNHSPRLFCDKHTTFGGVVQGRFFGQVKSVPPQ
jgi:hypothetical protein